MRLRNLRLLIGGIALSVFLLLQLATPVLAFSTAVTSGELAVLTSAQLTDIRNACLSLGLGGSAFCKSVAQKAVAVKETQDPGIVVTVKETRGKRFLPTLAGAVVGATVYGVEFATLAGDGNFVGSADHIVPASWGSIYFESGQKSNTSPMTIRITIDTSPPPVLPGSISGIASSDGDPVKEVVVTARMQGNPGVSAQDVSDMDGGYLIADLPPGMYDVEAMKSSYESLIVGDVVVSSGADTPVDFGLTLLPCSERPVKDLLGVALIDESLARRESGGASSTTEYVEESIRHIRQNGFTAIRVPFYWESYVYNPTEFVDRVEFIAQTAQANDLCVVFANFQYYTTSYWNVEFDGKSLGRGFPSFVVSDFPLTNNDYIQTAGPFWDAFLSNSITVDGISVWEVQANFFGIVISSVDSYDSVAGYEILNEPHLFDIAQYDKLGNYHTYIANEIRAVSDKKIYFDRETTWGFTRDPSQEPKIAPVGMTGIVYGPHLYSIPYPGTQAETQIQNFETWSELWGSEVLIGETVADTQEDADQLLKVLKENEFGWTVWSWKPTVSTGSGRTYYESNTVEATDVLKILLAEMAKVY